MLEGQPASVDQIIQAESVAPETGIEIARDERELLIDAARDQASSTSEIAAMNPDLITIFEEEFDRQGSGLT